MAVSLFDASASSKQATLARQEKAKAEGWGGGSLSGDSVKAMTAEQAEKFKNSSFMQQGQQIDETVKQLMTQKSQELMRVDCTWLPQDSDFTAPKSFKYDKFIDYYGVLGVADMATQAEIKAAYKRLSLVYHPDKTSGMDEKTKEEYAGIFIQLKNAYTTLLDNPTRRQFDWDRCKEMVMCQVCGGKMKTRDQFWGFEMNAEKYQQSMEKEQGPGIDVELDLICPLERFVYGGQETVWRNRRTRVKGEFEDRMKAYHIDVAPGTAEPLVKKFVRKGDEHPDRLADTLIFTLTSKPHDTVERADPDLHLKAEASLGEDASSEPYLSMEAPSVLGRHLLLWGRNPFFKVPGPGKELRCAVWGLGLRADGALRFTAREGGGLVHVAGLRSHPVWEVVGGEDKGGILVRDGKDASAKKCPTRLAFGAHVKQVELDGERLYYQRLTSTGPDEGWVATRIPGKELVVERPDVVCWEVLGGQELGLGGIVVRGGRDPSSEQVGRLETGSLVRQVARDGDLLQYEVIQDRAKGPETGWVLVGGEAEKRPDSDEPQAGGVDESSANLPEALRRRAQRRAEAGQVCEVDLAPFTEPLGLFTQPGCSIQFYSNLGQPSQVPSGQVRPRPMFGCLITSMSCSSEDNKDEWNKFKASFVPVLRDTAFRMLLRSARAVLPRPLAAAPVFPEADYGKDSSGELRPVPWERLADSAVKRGDLWYAAVLLSNALQEAPEESQATAGLLSKRADCYAYIGEAEASLADARRATESAPAWAKPWGQVGYASAQLPETAESLQESATAYSKAVELEPSGGDVEALHGVVAKLLAAGDAKTSDDEKARGSEALSKGEFGAAVAAYTSAISRVQPGEEAALAYALLFGNRSAAFAQLKMWDTAIADAQKAIEAKPDLAKAHARLGVALLGSGQCEKAYAVFAAAVKMDGSFDLAREGLNSCLVESIRMFSQPARARKARFHMDQWRPKGSTRIFAVCDVHFDIRINEEWVHNIDGLKFQDDVLIVAGDMADSFHQICRGLGMLKSKFRRVFYTPGCHEMWITVPEISTYQDSIVKLHAIFEACDAMGIDIAPAPVCQEAFVVPLFSWYNCVFDEKDPFPDTDVDQNPFCKWPIDKDEQVWKFFATMNESHLNLPYHGTVLTFSHILPRRDLPYWTHIYHQAKFIGCTDIDDQLRKINSKVHVYGRSHRRFGREIDGVIYVNMPLGKEDERMEEFPPLMLVFDRENVCAKEWGINDAQIANPTLAAIEKTHYGL